MKTLIRGGLIYDGTGAPPFTGDIVFEGKTICFVGEEYKGVAERIIDANSSWQGFVLCGMEIHRIEAKC